MIGRALGSLRGRAVGGACALCLALAPAGCGDTLQDRPISHSTLETLLLAPYPVYWLGQSFRRLALTEATHDPSGAFSVQYGDCKQGGQGTCVPPLRVVTSPDNSFLPGSPATRRATPIRGVTGLLTRGGRTIVIATAGVVVGIYALDRPLAAAAAQAMVPINDSGVPGARLPAALPDTGFAAQPLPAQMAPPLGRAR
ncbi:MAG: hypothetical protein E6F96_03410 [Actinobacteria bacterium]|nr:MAG: hypothetical protein E6F96_03410 [Actinomycetota bacterium]